MEKELDILRNQLASCRRLHRSYQSNSLWYKDDAGFDIECYGDSHSSGPEIIIANVFPKTTHRNLREEIELLNGLYTLTRDELDYAFPQGKYEYWSIREAMFYASLFGNQNHCKGYVLNQKIEGETDLMPEGLKMRIFAVDYYRNLRRRK